MRGGCQREDAGGQELHCLHHRGGHFTGIPILGIFAGGVDLVGRLDGLDGLNIGVDRGAHKGCRQQKSRGTSGEEHNSDDELWLWCVPK